MRTDAIVIVLVGLTLGLTTYIAANSEDSGNDQILERLDAIERRQAELVRVGKDVRALRDRLDRRLGALDRSIQGLAPSVPGASPLAAGATPEEREAFAAAAAAGGTLEAAVADRLERTVEQKMEELAARSRYRGADGQWKPPMGELERELTLADQQRRSLNDVFRSGRDEVFALLQTERPGQPTLLEEFADELKESEDHTKTGARFFGRLAKEKVPGTQQTFLAAAIELGERVRDRVEGHLDEAQRQRFRELNVDVLEVQIGYDPVGEYVKERLSQ